jgi:hypothetical protein
MSYQSCGSVHIHIHLGLFAVPRRSHPYAEDQPAASNACCICGRKKAFRNKFPTCGSCYRKATGIDSPELLSPPAPAADAQALAPAAANDIQEGPVPAPVNPDPELAQAPANPDLDQ